MGFFRNQYLKMFEKEFQKYDAEGKQIVVKQSDDKEATEVYIETALKHGYTPIQQSGSTSMFGRPLTIITFQRKQEK
jgi:hypothetical protein